MRRRWSPVKAGRSPRKHLVVLTIAISAKPLRSVGEGRANCSALEATGEEGNAEDRTGKKPGRVGALALCGVTFRVGGQVGPEPLLEIQSSTWLPDIGPPAAAKETHP